MSWNWLDFSTNKETLKQIAKICIPIAAASLFLCYKFGATPHDNVPGGPTLRFKPLVGHLLDLNEAVENNKLYDVETEQAIENDWKPFCISIPGPLHHVFIADPAIVHQIFTEDFHKAEKTSFLQQLYEEILGNGIFAADGHIWQTHRKAASKMLSLRSLRDKMFGVFCETSDAMVNKIDQVMLAGETLDLQDLFQRVTLDSFVEIAFGVKLDSTGAFPDVLPFATAFDSGFEVLNSRFTRTFWKVERFFSIGAERDLKGYTKTLDEFCKRVVTDRRRDRVIRSDETEDRVFKDLIDWFLSDPETNGMSWKELRDVTMNFIIAGRDTTATLLTWCVYELCRNPRILARVREEIMSRPQPSHKNITDMKYTEAVLWETLRLHPAVPSVGRVVLEDIQLKACPEMTLRKGDNVNVLVYSMGRSPQLWENPLEFNPERFLNENGSVKKIEPAVLPVFNMQPRLCLGSTLALLEARTMLWYFYRNFDVEIQFDENNRPERIPYNFSPVLKMKFGLPCRFTRFDPELSQ